jgi:integrase
MAKRGHGEGSITKRDNGIFLSQVSIKGERISKTFKTRKEAQEWIRTTTNQIRDSGMTYAGAKTTLAEEMDRWLKIKKSQVREASYIQYKRLANVYIIPHLGDLKLSELNSAIIKRFYTDLESKGIGASTIKCCHVELHGFFDHARSSGLMAQNWTESVKSPKPQKSELNIWTESQVNQFLLSVNADPFYTMAFHTGMRRGELIGLQWKDLNWENGMIKISRQAYYPPGGGFEFLVPKTDRGRRAIRLGPNMIELLRQHFKYTISKMIAIAGPEYWQEHDLIFPGSNGTPRVGSTVARNFKKQINKVVLPEIRFHDIRHTAASLMLLHGEPPVRVAGILGHSVQVLLNTYSHYIPDNQEGISNYMDQITTISSFEKVEKSLQLNCN